MTTTHFMLMYDSCSGTAIKDRFATLGVSDVEVGNFAMLLDMLLEYRLLASIPKNQWEYDVEKAILKNTKAFWSRSIGIDETAVLDEVTKSLNTLLNSMHLDDLVLPELVSSESKRHMTYYSDLRNLHNDIKTFPSEIQKAKLIKENINLKPIKNIVVYTDKSIPLLKWQEELIELLNIELYSEQYSKIYYDIFNQKRATKNKDISYMQNNLFSINTNEEKPKIENIQFLVARDLLQSVEVSAGMVQNIVKNGDSFEDITIVVPNGGFDKDFLIDTFDKFHIPLSRASKKEQYTDFATQWIKNAIQGQKSLSDPMVFASMLSSPIMPYSSSMGQYFAQKAFEDSLESISLDTYDEKIKFIITTVASWQKSSSVDKLFMKNLYTINDYIGSTKKLAVHKQRFKTQLEILSEYINSLENFDIFSLSQQINESVIEESISSVGYLKSVHVIDEHELYLDTTKHIIFLGFNDGHYPSQLSKQGVFSHTQWEELSEQLQLDLDMQQNAYRLNKHLFMQQIQSATQSITFLSSALDLAGDRMEISSTLSDIAYCFKDSNDKELDAEKHLIWLEKGDVQPLFYKRSLEETTQKEHYIPLFNDINLGINLFSLRKEEDGITNKPESPSSLEKLMISPLAWFLYRQGLESKVWGVQELNVAMQGTIAHGVYEDCFNKKNPNGDITKIDKTIEKRIIKHALFLNQPHLTLVKEQLVNEIKKSIITFKEMIDDCGMQVISAENKLTGSFSGINIAGRVDVIVEINGVKMIIDYKKSKSSKRVKRMEEGYDHQLLLYREMLGEEDAITAYFTLNDGTLVVDKEIGCNSSGSYTMKEISDECSVNAKQIMQENIADIKNGIIRLNSDEDASLWDKRGVTASYTLDSALVSFFIKDTMEEEV